MSTLSKTFALYLESQGSSKITIKNYLSDLRHFLAWTELYLKSRNLSFPQGRSLEEPQSLSFYFKQELVEKYKTYLVSNEFPAATINRRLSTLRKLAKFGLLKSWINENPTQSISNAARYQEPIKKTTILKQQEQITHEFKSYLELKKNSSNTIKSYLSDVREFLNYLAST